MQCEMALLISSKSSTGDLQMRPPPCACCLCLRSDSILQIPSKPAIRDPQIVGGVYHFCSSHSGWPHMWFLCLHSHFLCSPSLPLVEQLGSAPYLPQDPAHLDSALSLQQDPVHLSGTPLSQQGSAYLSGVSFHHSKTQHVTVAPLYHTWTQCVSATSFCCSKAQHVTVAPLQCTWIQCILTASFHCSKTQCILVVFVPLSPCRTLHGMAAILTCSRYKFLCVCVLGDAWPIALKLTLWHSCCVVVGAFRGQLLWCGAFLCI